MATRKSIAGRLLYRAPTTGLNGFNGAALPLFESVTVPIGFGGNLTESCQNGILGHIEHVKNEWESTADSLPQLVCLLDDQGHVVRANRTLERWGLGHVTDAKGTDLHQLLHPDCNAADCYLHGFWERAVSSLRNGEPAGLQVEDNVLKRHLDLQVHCHQPSENCDQCTGNHFAVAVVADIGALRSSEQELRAFTAPFKENSNRCAAEQLHEADANRRIEAALIESQEEYRKLWKTYVGDRVRAEQALKSSEQKLWRLSAKVMSMQEKERQRIASELHDGIGQTLSAFKFYVENALIQLKTQPPERGVSLFEALIPRIQGAIEEVRRISMDLRPSILDDLGILATLSWFIREFQESYVGIHVGLQVEILENDINKPLKLIIFRIIQEALNNVAKHARADTVGIQLALVDQNIRLEIVDHGVGFDQSEVAVKRSACKGGVGLLSMRERAEYSGGRFLVTSGKGKGTRILITWPADGLEL